MSKKIQCPRITCRSTDVEPVGVQKKAGLVKGAVGGALLGPFGAAAGLMSGKKEATFYCKKCGHTFTVKM